MRGPEEGHPVKGHRITPGKGISVEGTPGRDTPGHPGEEPWDPEFNYYLLLFMTNTMSLNFNFYMKKPSMDSRCFSLTP